MEQPEEIKNKLMVPCVDTEKTTVFIRFYCTSPDFTNKITKKTKREALTKLSNISLIYKLLNDITL